MDTPKLVIIPIWKMDTPYGLWEGRCDEPGCAVGKLKLPYTTGPTSAGQAGFSLMAHWKEKHGRS